MKRVFALLLALLFCLTPLVSCHKEEEGEKLIVVSGDGCNLIYEPKSVEKEQVMILSRAIEEQTGVKPNVLSTSSFVGGVRLSEGDILIGCVDTEIVTEAMASLRYKDYICGVYDMFYVIAGFSTDVTKEAISHFIEDILPKADEEGILALSADDNYHFVEKYTIDTLTVGGVSIGELEIVIPDIHTGSELRTALYMQYIVRARSGYTLPIVTASETERNDKQIRVGASLCDGAQIGVAHSYDVRVKGTTVQLAAESFYGYESMRSTLQYDLLNNKEKTLALTDDTHYTGVGNTAGSSNTANQGNLRLMFNNIWGDGENDYRQRALMQADIYAEYAPDIIGLQEFAPHMREVMVPVLKALGYEEIPVPANNKFHNSERNTRTPVFYRVETVELLEVHYCCLGDMNYNKYPELLGKFTAKEVREVAVSDCSKAVTYGIFRLKATGDVFLAGSTHLWWQDGAVHDTARIIQMQELRNVMTKTAADFAARNGITAEIPVFVGGDFNTRTSRDSYHSMGRTTPFVHLNTQLSTKDQLVNSTMHSYPYFNTYTGLWEKKGEAQGRYSNALDHIYVNEAALENVDVLKMGMAEEQYAYATSDHAPIYADVALTAASAKLPAQ